MGPFKVIIKKNNVPDNTKVIGKDIKLISIAELYIHLFSILAGSSDVRNKAISHFVGLHKGDAFLKSSEFLMRALRVLGIFC